jgi:hypothetical protein
MAINNSMTPGAQFADRFFLGSAKERVVASPGNAHSGGAYWPDRGQSGTQKYFLGNEDGGLPNARDTLPANGTNTAFFLGSESDQTGTSAPAAAPKSVLPTAVIGLGALFLLLKLMHAK